MSYTEHPDIDAARWFDEEERKSLEIEWLIEQESKKPCYNPFLLENIVEALCNLPEKDAEFLQNEFSEAKKVDSVLSHWERRESVFSHCMNTLLELSEEYQEKRIIENVMKGVNPVKVK